jgi:AbrB family looped-hinge helix DNA binding protein
MPSTLTSNGRVTIPKKIRDALDLQPGCKLNVVVKNSGAILMKKVVPNFQNPSRIGSVKLKKNDRFEQVRGKADIHWRTQDLMNLFRGEH